MSENYRRARGQRTREEVSAEFAALAAERKAKRDEVKRLRRERELIEKAGIAARVGEILEANNFVPGGTHPNRAVLAAIHEAGLSYNEIGDLLGITRQRVHQRMNPRKRGKK